jgi:hypothetical protein
MQNVIVKDTAKLEKVIISLLRTSYYCIPIKEQAHVLL